MSDQDWRVFADESDWHADDNWRPGDRAWLGAALCLLSAVFSGAVIYAGYLGVSYLIEGK